MTQICFIGAGNGGEGFVSDVALSRPGYAPLTEAAGKGSSGKDAGPGRKLVKLFQYGLASKEIPAHRFAVIPYSTYTSKILLVCFIFNSRRQSIHKIKETP